MPTLTQPHSPLTLFTLEEWQRRADEHRHALAPWTESWRARRSSQQAHPIHDFLFTYYNYSPAKLEQWQPGIGVAVEDSEESRTTFSDPRYVSRNGHRSLDPQQMEERERARLHWARELLDATRNRPGNFGCFGMHEWAMVYGGGEIRHKESAPLRMSQHELDAFVRSRPICCTHYDAFRFFTPAAVPFNRVQPTLESRPQYEQPACIHANMDLYKWAYKSMPWVGSDLLLATFLLSLEFRALDMRASPYDLRQYGYDPLPIETAEGRSQYEQEQRALAARAAPLRDALIDAIDRALT